MTGLILTKAKGWFELVNYGLQDRYLNHWALMIVNQFKRYKQFDKTFKSPYCDEESY